ncbi:substrate-binding periplasmic protein [Chitinibacteraceae bacterium HSL-7]
MPFLVLILMLLVPQAYAREPNTVIYPRHQARHDPQLDYVLEILKLGLAESGHTYRLQQSDRVMVQSRAIESMRRGEGPQDVIWTMTDPDRERELIPIRIPIYRGLIGWRQLLIRGDDAARFARIRSKADLQHEAMGQMHDWPDTTILRANGFDVRSAPSYEHLFEMLAAGRFDAFPRAVTEIRPELASHGNLPITIAPRLLIRYPTAFYFFVAPSRPQLSRDLARGLERAIASGQFQAVFERHFGHILQDLSSQPQTVIELKNPLLPPATPLDRSELWYHP